MAIHVPPCPLAAACPDGHWGAPQHWTDSVRVSAPAHCNNCDATCTCPQLRGAQAEVRAALDAAADRVKERATWFTLAEACARLGLDEQRVLDLADKLRGEGK